MNYFELHVGDYEAATAHLSMLEDAVYGRMIRLYYRTEKPLPVDVKKIARLVRAVSKPERDAVESVLADFFELRDDGWHQDRCDKEIARYVDGEPEREVKKANEANRLAKHRVERAGLFKQLTDAGQHAPWNIGIAELRALVKQLGKEPATPPETLQPPLPATATATPATATQTPLPRHQTPEEEAHASSAGASPTPVALVGMALKRGGIDPLSINTSDPRLIALVEQGATPEEFAGLAAEAVAKGIGKPFAWVLAVLPQRRAEASSIALQPRQNRQEAIEQRNRAVAEEWLAQQGNP